MERLDDWVTDRRLALADIERHLGTLAGDDLHLGRYRVVAAPGAPAAGGVLAYSMCPLGGEPGQLAPP